MSALSSLLVQDQVLSVTHVEQALQRQVIHGGDLATNLLELGLIDEVVLAEYLGRVLRMPVYPAEYLLAADPTVLKMIPWQIANDRRVVPVRVHGNTMVVAAAGPVPKGALDEVSFLLGVEVVPNLVLEFRLAMALDKYYAIPMPPRMAALQRKLAPDFVPGQRPVVLPPKNGNSLITSRDAEAASDAGGEDARSRRPDTTDRLVIESDKPRSQRDDESTLKFITGSKDSTNRVLAVMKAQEEMDAAAAEAEAREAARDASRPARARAPESEPPEDALYEGITSIPAPMLLKRSTALEMLEGATTRDEILDVFLKFASQAFEFSILLVVHGKTAQGRHIVNRGRGLVPAEFVAVPLDEGGMFEAVHTTSGYHLGPPGSTAVEEEFYRTIGREEPRSCAVIPVVLRGRVILLYYGDSGNRGVKANRVANLADFVRSVSASFEGLLLRQKYGQYAREAAPVTAPPAAPVEPSGKLVAVERKPPPRKRDLSSWAVADDAIGAEGWPEPLRPSIPSPVAPSQPDLAPPSDAPPVTPPPKEIGPAAFSPTIPSPDPESWSRPPEPAPAPAKPASQAVRMIVPSIITSPPSAPPVEVAPAVEAEAPPSDTAMPAPTSERVTEPAPADDEDIEHEKGAIFPDPELVKRVETIIVRSSPSFEPPDLSEKIVVDAPELAASPLEIPPASHAASAPAVEVVAPAAPSSVRVDMPEEIDRLVERVLSRGAYDEVAADLLVGIGDDALRELVRHFPGPLAYDRYQETSRLRKVAQHGPLLQTLIRFGKKAGPHIVPLLDGFDSEMRFYAVFCFSEIDYPEALFALTRRLFDNDRQIRVLAMDVMRRFQSYPEYRWAVQETAVVLTSSSSSLERKRMAAEALGELQDPVAIRALAEMLGSVDGILAERCQRALVRITFNDFGFSERRWLAWWQANKPHHRIEWAMNSLNHRVEEIRNAAIDELKRMIGGAMEWPKGPMDHKLRREVRRRCMQWWEREGRALHPMVDVD